MADDNSETRRVLLPATVPPSILDVDAREREDREALRDSEELLRITTQSAKLFTWEVDIATGISAVSANVVDVIGFTIPIAPWKAFDVLHPGDRPRVREDFDRAIATGTPFHSDQRMVNPQTGAIVWLCVDATLIQEREGRRARLVGISQNVTERVLAEQELRASEERLRLAMEVARIYTWDLDLDSGAIAVSGNADQVRGSPAPRTFDEGVAAVHPDDREHMHRDRMNAIAARGQFDSVYRVIHQETGAIEWVHSQGSVLTDDRDHPMRIVGITRNVTAEKNAENDLRSSREELEQRVEERTAELRRSAAIMAALLDERAQLLRQLVDAQEHERRRIARELHDEMGQHITALKMGLAALSTDAPPALQRLEEIVTRLDSSVDRLAHELRPPALDGAGLVAAIRQLSDHFTAESGVTVDAQIDANGFVERLSAVFETTLYRVLQEAFTNIRKHAAATAVSVILSRTPDYVQLIVEDDGCGFEPDIVVSSPTKSHFGLLGMRERIALAGGEMNIESNRGKGTTLYVRIPT